MKIALTLMILILSACAYPKRSTPFEARHVAADQAIIYLYRPSFGVDNGNPDVPVFYVNDQEIGKLSFGGYYALPVPPGPVKVTFQNPLFGIRLGVKNAKDVEFEAHAGQEYFVRYQVEGPFRTTTLKLVAREAAWPEINNTVLLISDQNEITWPGEQLVKDSDEPEKTDVE